jgi:hypothetical protein
MSKYFKFFYFFFIIITITGCMTYHLTTQSLMEQFADAKNEDKHLMLFTPPFFFYGSVSGNDIRTLKVYDKNEKETFIYVDGHTGVRITKKDSSRRTFYFNTLLIKDSAITGSKTHFFEWQITPIRLDDILKIEIQK